ncbi:MAG: hypothetical protein ACTSVV_17270 [Promethearchaeota archaeon]
MGTLLEILFFLYEIDMPEKEFSNLKKSSEFIRHLEIKKNRISLYYDVFSIISKNNFSKIPEIFIKYDSIINNNIKSFLLGSYFYYIGLIPKSYEYFNKIVEKILINKRIYYKNQLKPIFREKLYFDPYLELNLQSKDFYSIEILDIFYYYYKSKNSRLGSIKNKKILQKYLIEPNYLKKSSELTLKLIKSDNFYLERKLIDIILAYFNKRYNTSKIISQINEILNSLYNIQLTQINDLKSISKNFPKIEKTINYEQISNYTHTLFSKIENRKIYSKIDQFIILFEELLKKLTKDSINLFQDILKNIINNQSKILNILDLNSEEVNEKKFYKIEYFLLLGVLFTTLSRKNLNKEDFSELNNFLEDISKDKNNFLLNYYRSIFYFINGDFYNVEKIWKNIFENLLIPTETEKSRYINKIEIELIEGFIKSFFSGVSLSTENIQKILQILKKIGRNFFLEKKFSNSAIIVIVIFSSNEIFPENERIEIKEEFNKKYFDLIKILSSEKREFEMVLECLRSLKFIREKTEDDYWYNESLSLIRDVWNEDLFIKQFKKIILKI